MPLDGLPLFSALKGAMGFNGARVEVIARNIANADTPGYVPNDLSGGRFAEALQAQARMGGGLGAAQPTRTHRSHLAGPAIEAPTWEESAAPDSETTLDGNAVVVEEQVARMTQTRMAYEAAAGLYQKSLAMIRLAAKPPGR